MLEKMGLSSEDTTHLEFLEMFVKYGNQKKREKETKKEEGNTAEDAENKDLFAWNIYQQKKEMSWDYHFVLVIQEKMGLGSDNITREPII